VAAPASQPVKRELTSALPLPDWMAEWAEEDARDEVTRRYEKVIEAEARVPPSEPVEEEAGTKLLPVEGEDVPASEAATSILSQEDIWGEPAKPVEVRPALREDLVVVEPGVALPSAPGAPAADSGPTPVTRRTPVPEEFRSALDEDIRRLMQRTERFARAAEESVPAPAAATPPPFELPAGAYSLPEPKTSRAEPSPAEEPIDRLGVLDQIEKAAPPAAQQGAKKPSRPPMPAYEPPSMMGSLPPPSETRKPASTTQSPFKSPAFLQPPQKPAKMKDTARRVRAALSPILTVNPASPWLSLGIVMVGIVWLTAGLALRSGWLGLVGLLFLLPVIVSGALARRGRA